MASMGRELSTHPAVVTVSPSKPLEILQVPTAEPEGNEIKIIAQWTASTPLDMHMALGHLLVKPPQLLGDSVAGTVIAIGPDVQKFKIGDEVFGFVWKDDKQKAHQLICVAPENHFGLVPNDIGIDMPAAVTVPDNFVTAWHTLTSEFGFELPWPKPNEYIPAEEQKGEWILIWGGGSSVAMYTLQILNWYGYKHVAVVASEKHEQLLKRYGAKIVFDYRQSDVQGKINTHQDHPERQFKYLFDCIGSLEGSVTPVSQIARPGAKVAVLLPVIVRDAAKDVAPAYNMDVKEGVSWAESVEAKGVRTFFYMDNVFLAEKLQNEIMPAVLRMAVVEPNRRFVVVGETMLERAQTAITMLRDKQASGMRLVWQLANQEDVDRILGQ